MPPRKKSASNPESGKVIMSREAFVSAIKRAGKRTFTAADTGRLRAEWTAVLSTNSYNDIKAALPVLIARSKDAYNNNPYARAIVNVLTSNIISQGIKPTPRISLKEYDSLNEIIASYWSRVNDELDITDKQTFYELENTIFKAVILTGGALINIVKNTPGSGKILPFSVQVFDQSKLDTTQDIYQDSNAINVMHGIEYDRYLRPVSYRFVSGEKVPATNIIHVYRRDLPDQLIGIPWLSSVLNKLYDIESLVEDTCIASRIQSSVGLWTKKDEDFIDEGSFNTDLDAITIEPGMILRTATKPEVVQANDTISKVIEPLIRTILHSVSISQGFSYGLLTRDLNNSNFSASRQNTFEDRRFFSSVQRWFVKDCCQKIWQKVVQYLLIGMGKRVDLTKIWDLSQASWLSDSWEYINPLQDAQADIALLQARLMTDQMYFADKGLVYSDVYKQLAAEKIEKESLGISTNQVTNKGGSY